jgi:hypothetical protein
MMLHSLLNTGATSVSPMTEQSSDKTKPTLSQDLTIPTLAPIQAPIQDWTIFPPLPPILVPTQPPIQPPIQPPTQSPMLVSVKEFTPDYVNNYFGFKVNKCKYEKMLQLHLVWHEFHVSNIASFVFSGPLNLWGFHSVCVLNRETWDARILATAKKMARQVNGNPASRPIQSIYEIMKYNGMCVERTYGEYTHSDMKALSQNKYFFDPCSFEKTKKRAKGW